MIAIRLVVYKWWKSIFILLIITASIKYIVIQFVEIEYICIYKLMNIVVEHVKLFRGIFSKRLNMLV